MDFWQNIILGFSVISEPSNIFLCFVGVLLGTLVGVLPGLGPVATIALLLPLTYNLPAVASIIMLSGIYYGSRYGGSTTAILMNIPGEADAVITCLDGYVMARQGRAGPALGIAAFGSFIAGTIGVVGLMLMAPLLAEFSLRFGPPEIFGLMCLALMLLINLTSGSAIKAMMMISLGMFLGTIGMDTFTAEKKFTFGIVTLYDGIGLVPVIMGVFGIGEVLANVEQGIKREIYDAVHSSILPTLRDWKESIGPILRGTLIGFFVGLLPGGGPVLSTFASYTAEKRVSKNPDKFGKGAIEGVAGPESANNATASSNFIPLMTLGIPCNSVMAILLAALLISGLKPGPLLITDNPSLFWGVIASMYIGNVMLLLLNLPLIGLWVQILRIPYFILFPLILFLCIIGSYSLNNNIVEVNMMIIFGVMGYLLKKLGYELAPLVMAFVLCPLIEGSLIRSLKMAQGSFSIFYSRPICLMLILIAIFLLFASLFRKRPLSFEGMEDD